MSDAIDHDDHEDEAPPASTRVLRVRRLGDGFAVYGGETALTDVLPTKEAALARAREEAGAAGALILVESDGGFDAEAVPPSSSSRT